MDRNPSLDAPGTRIIDADPVVIFRERFNRDSFAFQHALRRHPPFTLPRLAQLLRPKQGCAACRSRAARSSTSRRQAKTPYSTCRISPVLTLTRIASVSSRTHS